MKAKLKKWKWSLISLALAMVLAVSCAGAVYFEAFEEVDNMLLDEIAQQFDIKEDVPIRIIAIDQKTIERLGVFDSWSRQVSANMVNILNSGDEKPVMIGMDLLYENEGDIIGDAAFARACELAENVCLVVRKEEPVQGDEEVEELPEDKGLGKVPDAKPLGTITYPYDSLKEVVTIGISDNFEAGNNEIVREFAPMTKDNDQKLESFAIVLYKAYQEHAGKTVRLNDNEETLIRFNYSRALSEYETYSFIDVLNGSVDPNVFANTIVIIGDFTEKNRYNVPDSRGGQMPNAGLQANMVEALLSRKVVYQLPGNILAGIYGMLIFGCYTLVFLIRRKKSIPISLFILAIHFQLAYFLRNWYYLPIFTLWLFALFAILLGLFIGYYREKENKKNLQKALKAYVESDIVEQILENNEFDIKLGNERRNIAVLFVDIRGFTTISESLPPEEIVPILNEYLEMVARAVIKNGGNIDKFIGDAAMAIFNAPKDLDNYVVRAVYTAWDILKGASKLKEDCLKKYGKEVTFGIGVHCGPAIVGNIGCECRMDYTAIGDTVNTASRLEANAKAGQILISSDVYEIVKDRVKVEPIGKLALKGKMKEIETYQVTGIFRKDVSV